MRPRLRFLDDDLAGRILDEARSVLATLGVELHDPEGLDLLASHGATVVEGGTRVRIPEGLVDRALATAPRAFALYDVLGNPTHDLSGENVHFTPGSAAIRLLDPATRALREPVTADYVRFAKLVAGLPHLAAQSTAFVPSDVPPGISDSYRLFLGLLHCEKPVVTGAFSADAFRVMLDLQLAVRGTAGGAPRKAPRRLHLLSDVAPGVERGDGAEPPRLRTGRHSRRDRRGASRPGSSPRSR